MIQQIAHTPGPWRTVPTTVNTHAGTKRLDVVSDGSEFSPSYVACDILPEDARLIAVAPDLLEACREVEQLMFQIATVAFNEKTNDYWPSELQERVKDWVHDNSVMRAIAKYEKTVIGRV
jgi:hypothetical protein